MRYIARAVRVLKYGGDFPPLPDGVDFIDVFNLSKMHSLASSLWYVLEPRVRAEGNRALIDKWDGQMAMDFAKNLVQQREFAALTSLFSSEGIKFLPLKGFLFKKLWARPEHRTMADMDFVVEEDNLSRVSELLISRGYRAEVEDGLVHDTFDKPPYLHVEVHKSLFADDTDGFDKWVAREDNPYWYVMLPEDFLVFNVGHIHKHFVGGGCGARSLFDVYLYLTECGGDIDNQRLEAALAEKGLSEFYKKLLHLVYFWYGDGTYPFTPDKRYIKNGEPTDELLEMEYFIITGGSYGNDKNRVELAVERKGKLAYILELAFPRYRTMRDLYPVLKRVPVLLPFFYPIRWIHYTVKGKSIRFAKYIFSKKKNAKK